MAQISETSLKMEVGLWVSDLAASEQFYRTLFQCSPVRRWTNFVRFDVEEPPLMLALRAGGHLIGGGLRDQAQHSPGTPAVSQSHATGDESLLTAGSINHLGFRVDGVDRLIEIQQRLEAAGLTTNREDDVECCYSFQTKFWVSDPNRNVWEIYVLEDPDSANPAADTPDTAAASQVPAAPPALPTVFGHRADEPLTLPLPVESETVDEAFLEGTLDAGTDATWRQAVLEEILRILKPGGSVSLRLLVDAPEAVTEPIAWLTDVGFAGETIDLLQPATSEETSRWELHISGLKAADSAADRSEGSRNAVVYLGPAVSVELTAGPTFCRGRPEPVDAKLEEVLRSPGFIEQITHCPVVVQVRGGTP